MNSNLQGASRKAWLTYLGLAQAFILVFALASACSSKPTVGDVINNGGSVNASGGSAGTGTAGGLSSGGSVSTTGGTAPITVGGGSGTEKCVTSCKPAGGQWCGEIGNNCSGTFMCPPCSDDWVCKDNLCIGPPSCKRLTCDAAGGHYCGTIGDGCGGALVCGDCPDAGICGGGGIPNLCKPANCTPRECIDAKSGGQYCGDIGDGCGGLLHCGDCAGGKTCGAEGVANVCPGAGCKNLQCTIRSDACPMDSPTTLTGTVYDPAGKLPLYNALVYVPNDPLPLPPIADGITCEPCGTFAAGSPVATALTDVNGKFTLSGVPSGANVPLVIQVGRWRREVTLNTTLNKCTSNAITDVNQTRLPRNKAEGHIPRIAVTTGGLDALECLLRRIGIADEEFTTDAGEGRVHLYIGGDGTAAGGGRAVPGAVQFSAGLGGGQFAAATTLWSSPAKLKNYDIMMLSCEGDEVANVKQPYLGNVAGYMNQGGRVFADHYHYYWMRSGSADLKGTATYAGSLADPTKKPLTAHVDTSFVKGAALADWLVLTGASTVRGDLDVIGAQHSVTGVNPPTQRWIYLDPADTAVNQQSIQYMSFNTPVTSPAENQCGRVVFTDIHIAADVGGLGGDTSTPDKPFPEGCKDTGMSPQAKALEFLFFDLSSCVTPPDAVPVPPPPGVPPPTLTPPPPPPPPPPPAK
jgi:hypothetical protein